MKKEEYRTWSNKKENQQDKSVKNSQEKETEEQDDRKEEEMHKMCQNCCVCV